MITLLFFTLCRLFYNPVSIRECLRFRFSLYNRPLATQNSTGITAGLLIKRLVYFFLMKPPEYRQDIHLLWLLKVRSCWPTTK